jgi:hypothetical protein
MYYLYITKQTIMKNIKDKSKKEKIEFFTDDMAKQIFLFQDKMGKSSKPVTKTISFKPSKK